MAEVMKSEPVQALGQHCPHRGLEVQAVERAVVERPAVSDGEDDIGTVVGSGERGLLVTLENGEVELPEAYLAAGNLSHGYALTVHKAQGATCDVALVWGENLGAESGYTALTRGRLRNRAFVMAESNGGEHLLPEQRDPAQYLAQRLLAAARRPAASDARGLR
jgi:ATP-dependent exoDNAse (exonuclease V) alpha subunit